MSITQSDLTPSPDLSNRVERLRQIDSSAWAVFFIWVGIVMLVGISWPWFLIGIGVLILGAQLMRRQWNLRVERVGVAMGFIFLTGGIWDLLALPWPFIPIMLVGLGGYLLWQALSPKIESSPR